MTNTKQIKKTCVNCKQEFWQGIEREIARCRRCASRLGQARVKVERSTNLVAKDARPGEDLGTYLDRVCRKW